MRDKLIKHVKDGDVLYHAVITDMIDVIIKPVTVESVEVGETGDVISVAFDGDEQRCAEGQSEGHILRVNPKRRGDVEMLSTVKSTLSDECIALLTREMRERKTRISNDINVIKKNITIIRNTKKQPTTNATR